MASGGGNNSQTVPESGLNETSKFDSKNHKVCLPIRNESCETTIFREERREEMLILWGHFCPESSNHSGEFFGYRQRNEGDVGLTEQSVTVVA
ncbi:hypothetical protein AAHA92_09469 [Salvia divinorum]|uniref:Uncharacterized protein n=1 Tax=Salvia divinorum TaxID=28513 RepID=A0ABD1HRL9_SALDI